jgi:hypothetical protein
MLTQLLIKAHKLSNVVQPAASTSLPKHAPRQWQTQHCFILAIRLVEDVPIKLEAINAAR